MKAHKKNKQQSCQQDYQLSLTFEGPLLSQATGAMVLGLDVAMQRDSRDNRPALNGSLIRGNIRHSLIEFARLLGDEKLTQDVCYWFGDKSESGNYEPQRAQANFDFFWTLDKHYDLPDSQNHRTRIEINKETGTVNEGSLQVVEDCFPIGCENPTFSGKITHNFKHFADKKNFKKWLNKALDYIPAMGSFKGVGFGRLINSDLKEIGRTTSIDNIQPEDFAHFGIRLEIDRPFCIGKPRTADSNVITSEEIIPGNLIKALIARTYHNNSEKLEKELCFDKLIITHALPTDRKTLARKYPASLSLAVLYDDLTKKEKIIDMATAPTITRWEHVPSFAPDWKESDRTLINDFINQPDIRPKRCLILRTEIKPENNISEEAKLFSQECIDPSEHDWYADVNLYNISKDKRPAVFKILQNIFNQGLTGIGKTKAEAKVTLCKKAFIQQSGELKAGTYIITLTSPARMLPPNLRIPGTNSAQALKMEYQKYWRKILSDNEESENIQLISYYAQQTLASTYYHQQRYLLKHKKYYPEWLSNAGSVFILRITDKKALEKLQLFSHTGLEAHAEIDGSAAHWKTTPYLPEHGYGEIKIKAIETNK